MLLIHWSNLQMNHEYYTKMSGPTFGTTEYTVRKIKITCIQNLPMGEAMIYGVNQSQVLGLAVGGIFETTQLGPKHCFWINEDSYSAAAAG